MEQPFEELFLEFRVEGEVGYKGGKNGPTDLLAEGRAQSADTCDQIAPSAAGVGRGLRAELIQERADDEVLSGSPPATKRRGVRSSP